MSRGVYICPSCGDEVRVGRPCQVCSKSSRAAESRGSKARPRGRKRPRPPVRRSWEQDEEHDGLDLPDDDFDYDDFVAREFGGCGRRGLIRVRWYWWITALSLVVILILLSVRGFW